jgi:penicillin G amidase
MTGLNSADGQVAVEIWRDRWGTPHIFAERESDGFFGLGYICAQDRILQMDLLRRRANGRLAEIFGAGWIDSDRKFRTGGIARHCGEAFANLPTDLQDNLRAYAAGVNAFLQAEPQAVTRRFAALNYQPEPWYPTDCIAAWMGLTEIFDLFVDDRTYWTYGEVGREAETDPVLEELSHFQYLM